jgi:hypothetical protein
MPIFTIQSFEPYVLSDRDGVFAAIEMECIDEDDSPLHLSCIFLIDYSPATGVNFPIERDGQTFYKARFPVAAYSAVLDLLLRGAEHVQWSTYRDVGGSRVTIGNFPDGESDPDIAVGFASPEPPPTG